MARTCERVMEERMRSALALVQARCRIEAARAGGGRAFASLSYAELSSALGVSREQVRCVLRRLSSSGLLVVRARYLPNGGQAENAFLVTEAGRAFLHAAVETSELPALTAGTV